MKTLAVVGDSFMATDPDHPGTHFTELLQKRFNCKLENLARGAASNLVIYLQLKHLLFKNGDHPNFVIVGFTSYQRYLISDTSEPLDHISDKIDLNQACQYHKGETFKYWFNSVDNINDWVIRHSLDKQEVNKTIVDRYNLNDDLNERIINFSQAYPLIEDHKVELSISIAIQIACISLLHNLNIPFTFYTNNYDPVFMQPEYKERYYDVNSEYNPWNYTNTYNFAAAGYHTNYHAQTVLADLYAPLVGPHISNLI